MEMMPQIYRITARFCVFVLATSVLLALSHIALDAVYEQGEFHQSEPWEFGVITSVSHISIVAGALLISWLVPLTHEKMRDRVLFSALAFLVLISPLKWCFSFYVFNIFIVVLLLPFQLCFVILAFLLSTWKQRIKGVVGVLAPLFLDFALFILIIFVGGTGQN